MHHLRGHDRVPISIHALREEGDSVSSTLPVTMFLFLSTPSARRATVPGRLAARRRLISIHALREEGDGKAIIAAMVGEKFLSTPSARRATEADARNGTRYRISIHALREEGDEMPIYSIPGIERNFYPRPPRGGRRVSRQSGSKRGHNFYPRPPRGGRLLCQVVVCKAKNFYPRPPRGGRPQPFCVM